MGSVFTYNWMLKCSFNDFSEIVVRKLVFIEIIGRIFVLLLRRDMGKRNLWNF